MDVVGPLILLMLSMTLNALDVPTRQQVFDRHDDIVKSTYESIMKSAIFVKPENLLDFQPMIIDKNQQQIIVGARDAVIKLDVRDLKVVEKFHWPASPTDREMCEKKGQKEVDCHNFVRLLAIKDDKILMCGTNAYFPTCTWRKVASLSGQLQPSFSGIGFAPYGPAYENTYVMTKDGQNLFTGVVTDFAGHSPAILRMISPNRILKTAKANNRWLNDPSFVASYEIGNFIYIFFREQAVEVSACGKFVYSRVARICKNDVGGDSILKDNWSTFNKARLNCSLPGTENNFGFDQLQSVHFSSTYNTIFAVFTTVEGGVPGSAICSYDVANVYKAFAGPYRYQSSYNSYWTAETNRYSNFNCETQGVLSTTPNLTKRPLHEAQRYQLMYDAVQPNYGIPLHVAMLERYKYIAIDVLSIKTYGRVFIVFVLTLEGFLKKFTYSHGMSNEACLVEIMQISPPDSVDPIEFTGMELHKEKNSLIITSKNGIIKIPVQRCDRHTTERKCLDAKDPYCGWDKQRHQCTMAPIDNLHDWHQQVDGCPLNDGLVDGQFGQWSVWFNCPQQHNDESGGDNCLCRTRNCDSPAPSAGGKPCTGPTVQVTNCTQHGAWATWSDWSGCSTTCGSSVRSRKRSCSSPSPTFGGRMCLGLDVQQEFCPFTDCPVPTPAPVHGGWSDWSRWDPCTKPCNGGQQKRSRTCNSPTPVHNGNTCPGCNVEHRACNVELCREVTVWSEWTQWFQTNRTTRAKAVQLKRYRLACHASVDSVDALTMTSYRSEEKTCTGSEDDDKCENLSFRSVDGNWGTWGAWSTCSASCMNGTQRRIRLCNNPAPMGNGLPCSDHGLEIRQCNTHPCEAKWSCWSEYSDCSTTCGRGYKHRQRTCVQPHPGAMHTSTCEGERVQSITCESGPCTHDGYGEWSGWSACNKLGVQVRIRPCLSVTYCRGVPDAQMQQCHWINNDKGNEALGPIYQASSNHHDILRNTNWTLVACIMGAFFGGMFLTFFLLCYILRRRSNCCFGVLLKKPSSSGSTTCPSSLFSPIVMPPSTPQFLKSTNNIYTPPPSLRNVHPIGTSQTMLTPPTIGNGRIGEGYVGGGATTPSGGGGGPPTLTMNPLLMNHYVQRGGAGVKGRSGRGSKSYDPEDDEYDDDENEYDGLSVNDKETSLSATLKRHMRASLKTRDYL